MFSFSAVIHRKNLRVILVRRRDEFRQSQQEDATLIAAAEVFFQNNFASS